MRFLIKGGEETIDVFLDLWKKVTVLVPAKILVHRLKVVNRVDVRRWLPKLMVPCLYIQASSDRSVPASCLLDFMESVTDLRVQRIPGPHFILQAKPQAALSAIQNFAGIITDQSREK